MALQFFKHTCKKDFKQGQPHLFVKCAEGMDVRSRDVLAFLEREAHKNCQTKAILGFTCHEDVNITSPLLEKAIQTLREDFLFVGLVEFEHQSAQQLYHYFSGIPLEDQEERIASNIQNTSHHNFMSLGVFQQTRDIMAAASPAAANPDLNLYIEAKNLFWERMEQVIVERASRLPPEIANEGQPICGKGHHHAWPPQKHSLISQPSKQRIFWMHSEKTGEFYESLMSVMCSRFTGSGIYLHIPEKETKDRLCDVQWLNPYSIGGMHFGWHHGYRHSEHKGTAVTLIRDPVARLVSAFFFVQPCGHRPRGMKGKKREWCIREDPSSEFNITKRMHMYLAEVGVRFCQTKMIIGDLFGMKEANCGSDDSDITEEMGAEARRRLREEFVFVGLSTPFFDHSKRLFHATFAPQYGCHPETEKEEKKVRVSKTSPEAKEEARAAIVSFTGGDLDQLVYFDRLLYEEAQRIFWPRYNRYFDDGLQLSAAQDKG